MTKRTTFRIEVPKAVVIQQLDTGGHSPGLRDGRDLSLKDPSTPGLRNLLVLGASSPQRAEANQTYFQSLRTQVRHAALQSLWD